MARKNSTCDYARFARLYLEGGAYNGQQILPQQWVKDSLDVSADYSKPGPYFAMTFIAGIPRSVRMEKPLISLSSSKSMPDAICEKNKPWHESI